MKHCTIRALRPFEGSIILAHVEVRCRADGLVESTLTGQVELPIECAAFARPYAQLDVQEVDGAAPPLVPQALRIAQPWHGTVPTVPTLDELVTSGVAEADAEAVRAHEARCAAAGLWPYGVGAPDLTVQFDFSAFVAKVQPGELATALCYAIERLPASPEATELSVRASDLRRDVESFEKALRESPRATAPVTEDGPKIDLPATPAPPPADLSHFEARRAELVRLSELPDRGGSLRDIIRNHNLAGVGNAKSEMIEAILAHEFPNG